MSSTARWRGLGLGVMFVGLTASCGTSSTPAGSLPGTDSGVDSGADAPISSGTVSLLVTAAAGGTITNGNTSLTIPPLALAQDTTITLTIVPKTGNALVDVSTFGPDGLVFLEPAKLSIKADASITPAGQRLAVGVQVAAAFNRIPGSSYATGVASSPIGHFSSFAIIAVPAPGGGCLAGGPGDPCGPLGGSGGCCPGTPDAPVLCFNNAGYCAVDYGGKCDANTACRGDVATLAGGPATHACNGTCCALKGNSCGVNSDCCSNVCTQGSGGFCE